MVMASTQRPAISELTTRSHANHLIPEVTWTKRITAGFGEKLYILGVIEQDGGNVLVLGKSQPSDIRPLAQVPCKYVVLLRPVTVLERQAYFRENFPECMQDDDGTALACVQEMQFQKETQDIVLFLPTTNIQVYVDLI